MSDQKNPEQRFSEQYPSLYHFLEVNIWTGVDGYNLLEMFHRVMRYSHHDEVRNLVLETQRLVSDTSLADSAIVELFNRDVPAEFQIMNAPNCRALLNTLAGFLTYLFDVEHLQGRQGPVPSETAR
jgi:hypothetical protein